MSGGVYNVDFYILVLNGSILGKNCDTAFTFQVVVVHYSVYNSLIFTIHTALFKHFVNQCCLAVVNVGDDSDVT